MSFDKYTSIGSYPLFYIIDGVALCYECAEGCAEENEEAVLEKAVNWEDPNLYCDECDCRIESAYADPDSEQEDKGGE